MEDRKTMLGNKTVLTSESYQPRKEFMGSFIGRQNELRLVTAAWLADRNHLPMCPLMVGDPGVGKNRLVYELARITGSELFIFQGHEDVTAEDLACSVRFSDHSSTVMDYILSPLVTAMERGGICFIDEIGKIRPRALALLVSVLDERRYIDSNLLGERIHAHRAFRFIAATNSTDQCLLPEFIVSRMKPVIRVEYPEPEEIDEVIRDQYRAINGEINELLRTFWHLWKEHKTTDAHLSTRDALHIFSMASNLAAMDPHPEGQELATALLTRLSTGNAVPGFLEIRNNHLEKAFRLMVTENHK